MVCPFSPCRATFLTLRRTGVWRSPKDGHIIESSGIKKAGVLGSLKGLTGAVARVQGKGGF